MKNHNQILLALAFLFIFGSGFLPAASGDNIIENGGLEEWVLIPPASSDRPVPKVPEGDAPKGFTFSLLVRQSPVGEIVITKDTLIKRSGDCSVRIENTDPDLACSLSLNETPIEPNTRYKGRIWAKHKNLSMQPGTGVMLVVYYGPADNFWGNPSVKRERIEMKVEKESMDWQAIDFSFETGPDDTVFSLGSFMSWSSGVVWFDDLEVTPVGPAGSR